MCSARIVSPLFIRHLMNHPIPSESRIVDNNMNFASAELGRFLTSSSICVAESMSPGDSEGFSACVVDGFGRRSGPFLLSIS